jgi:hypothetical protein
MCPWRSLSDLERSVEYDLRLTPRIHEMRNGQDCGRIGLVWTVTLASVRSSQLIWVPERTSVWAFAPVDLLGLPASCCSLNGLWRKLPHWFVGRLFVFATSSACLNGFWREFPSRRPSRGLYRFWSKATSLGFDGTILLGGRTFGVRAGLWRLAFVRVFNVM